MLNVVLAGLSLAMALDTLYDLFDSFTVKELLIEMLFLAYWVSLFLWNLSQC